VAFFIQGFFTTAFRLRYDRYRAMLLKHIEV
jgi:hypothetical protein